MAGNPELNGTGLVAIRYPDSDAALLGGGRDVNGLRAGRGDDDPVLVALLVVKGLFHGGDVADLITGRSELDLLRLPLVMARLDKDLLSAGLIVPGHVAADSRRVKLVAQAKADAQAGSAAISIVATVRASAIVRGPGAAGVSVRGGNRNS